AGGPEVKAAAQVALSGPKSYLTYFLTTSQFQAMQRDQEQAAHVQAARALVIQTQEYAQKALADAATANKAALAAWGKVDEANKAAAEAAGYANKAAGYANDAKKSAAEAKASADQAAQSATKAKQAAASAQASADAAAQSAATATAAATRARADADAAYAAKRDARASANAAGKDAAAADAAAKEASAIYTRKLKEYEAQRRNTAPGTGADGVGSAADDHKTWGCLELDPSAVSMECLKVYKDFAGALADQPKCATPTNANSPGCRMLGDLKSFIGENDEVMLDMLQFVLMGCGLVPVAGEACDGIDAAVSFSRGDWAGGLLSLGSAIPGLGWASTGVKAWKNSDKLRGIKQLIDKIRKKEGGGCPNSFVPGTRVLLADGRSEEIEDLRIGDAVLATDPVLGRTGAREISATISSVGTKNLVDLDVVDGDRTATISATDNHPFWVPKQAAWLPAGELNVGTELLDDQGGPVRVTGMRWHTEVTRVHNLTVEDLHTYYVLAGSTPVLAHNCGSIWTSTHNKTAVRNAYDHYVKHGSEFPDVQNSLQYVTKAKSWFDNPPATVQTKTRSNGDVVRYDAESDYFGVITADGRPKTFFVPDPSKHNYATNQEYFDAQ
ncbi:polymorphic toxin-type HINT domain-containing protein, partial [Actinoplanes xinjiangensis]|uniref:polymorphic toxin-type HINT domain-containing protein n=1 Tax=Actinoplanes xinjiangensis TaxID=512350 RepID=UPI00342AAA6C